MDETTRNKAFKRTQVFASILDRLNYAEGSRVKPKTKALSAAYTDACSAFKDLTSDSEYLKEFHHLITAKHDMFDRPSDALYFAIENWNKFIEVERSVLKDINLPTYLIDNICDTLEDVIGFLPMLDAELNDNIDFKAFMKGIDNVQERICFIASGLEYEATPRRYFENTILRIDSTASVVAHANLVGGITYGDPLFTSSGVVATALWARKLPKKFSRFIPKKGRDD